MSSRASSSSTYFSAVRASLGWKSARPGRRAGATVWTQNPGGDARGVQFGEQLRQNSPQATAQRLQVVGGSGIAGVPQQIGELVQPQADLQSRVEGTREGGQELRTDIEGCVHGVPSPWRG